MLLLDEPLSNLDKKLREQMRLELKHLQRALGITTIFVTHDQEEALTIADRIAVLDAGVLQQIGTPRELFDAPANRFVAEFVGSTNLLAGRSDSDRGVFIADGLGEIPLTAVRPAPRFRCGRTPLRSLKCATRSTCGLRAPSRKANFSASSRATACASGRRC